MTICLPQMIWRSTCYALIAMSLLLVPQTDLRSQTRQKPKKADPSLAVDPARTATVGTTPVGQRQVAPVVNPAVPDPYSRIANRVQNRVQNRLNSRIDPSYRPGTGVADPFKAATAEPEIGKGKKPL